VSLDDLADLMAEPPGGHQHGRKRGVDGGWVELDEVVAAAYEEHMTLDPQSHPYHRPVKPEDTIVHGTRSAYVNDRCRCDDCREANREYIRTRRYREDNL
jgi:hypothetical protein